MIELSQWAKRHNVSDQALLELSAMWAYEVAKPTMPDVPLTSEAAVQAEVMLTASRRGDYLWRNNVGVAMGANGGRPVRYGLANDSKRLNSKLKSSDLIGWRPLLIGPEHVGHRVAQFLSLECKRRGWKYTGTEREVAQANWINLVNTGGGYAAFTTGEY